MSLHDTTTLPPAEEIARLPEIAAAAREVAELRERHRVESQNLTELEHERDGADMKDTQAAADALRAGKPDPGRKATEKKQKAIDALAPTVAALERAVGDAESDLRKAIAEHADAHRAKLSEEAEEQRTRCRELADQMGEVFAERQRTLALRSWLADPRRFNPLAFHLEVPALTGMNGSHPTVVDVVGALAQALEPPKPSPSNASEQVAR